MRRCTVSWLTVLVLGATESLVQTLARVSRQTPVMALALVAVSGLLAACGRSDDDWRYEEIAAGSPRDNLVGIWTAGPGSVRAFNNDGDLKWLTLEGEAASPSEGGSWNVRGDA